MYKRVALELKERARQRLLSDARTLTAEARRARILLREVTQILQQLDEDTAEWIARNVPKSYLRGVRVADLSFGEIGITGPGNIQPLVHREAIQTLVNNLQDDLLDKTERMERGYRTLVRRTQLTAARDKAITDSVARGIAEGKARREVSREIKAKLIDELGDAPLVINGRNYRPDKYAELVARTMTREAQTAGTVNRVIEAGHDLVMVTAHGAKDGCGFYEGKVFSISGVSDKYPSLDQIPNGGPPFHPNCRHGLAPFVEPLASGAEIRRAKGVPNAALDISYKEAEKLAKRKVA
jgi:predicted transcriptional regulator